MNKKTDIIFLIVLGVLFFGSLVLYIAVDVDAKWVKIVYFSTLTLVCLYNLFFNRPVK